MKSSLFSRPVRSVLSLGAAAVLLLAGGCEGRENPQGATAAPEGNREASAGAKRSVPEPTVVVDWRVEHQVIDNFGASDCWSMQKIGAWSDENKNRVADLLFSPEGGIALSAWRFNLGGGLNYEEMGGPDSWRTVETFEVGEGEYDWSRQAEERWFLGAAKARGVEQFIAFSNSPPGRMTRNGRTFASDKEGSSNLKDGFEGQFARYLADIAEHFSTNPDESQRIEFDWISPINEPQWPWVGGGQEGCRASNEDIKAIVVGLDAALRERGLKTKILIPESGIMYNMYADYPGLKEIYGEKVGGYLNAFCNDPDVNTKLGNVLCCHSYLADLVPEALVPEREKLRAAFEEYPDWRYWQTEYCVMEGPEGAGGGGRDLTMKTALDVARVIHCDLTICNASAWQWWTAVSPVDYKDGLIYTDYKREGDPETIYPAKLLWVFGNYSRFVRPGAGRIEITGANDIHGLLGSAYKSASGDEIVIVFINMSETEKTVSLGLEGLPSGMEVRSFTPHVTSEADDLKAYAPVAAAEEYVVPARAAVTLVGRLTGV